jgi:hypothetical protein
MAYKCLSCGHIFEEGEQSYYEDKHGLENPPFERVVCCPICGGVYEETERCKICGCECLEEELNSEICDVCVDKYSRDIDICLKIGEKDTETVELNCFLAFVFDKEYIEKLLLRELNDLRKCAKSLLEMDCEKFVEMDRCWFAERLLEELEKENK